MAYNYTQDEVQPLVIALQGVQDKAHRHALEELITSYGCEWREPDFLARNVNDILSDDVTHLFEGPFIADNGRTVKEAACFTDALGQGCTLLKSDEALIETLEAFDEAFNKAVATTHIHATDIDDWLLLCAQPLPPLHVPSEIVKQQDSHVPFFPHIGRKEGPLSNSTNSSVDNFISSPVQQHTANEYIHLLRKLVNKVNRMEVEMSSEEMLCFIINGNIHIRDSISAKSMTSSSHARRSCAALYTWSLTLAACDRKNETTNSERNSNSVLPSSLLSRLCKVLEARCLAPPPSQSSQISSGDSVSSQESDSSQPLTPMRRKGSKLLKRFSRANSSSAGPSGSSFDSLTGSFDMPSSPDGMKSPSLSKIFGKNDNSVVLNKVDSTIPKSPSVVKARAVQSPHLSDPFTKIPIRSSFSPTATSPPGSDSSSPTIPFLGTKGKRNSNRFSSKSPVRFLAETRLVQDEFGSFREVSETSLAVEDNSVPPSPSTPTIDEDDPIKKGKGSRKSSKAWRTAKKSVTVLSLALGKRKRTSLEIRLAKEQQEKEFEKSKAVHIVRQSCLLDPLIGALSSNALCGVSQARSVLWLTSITDLLDVDIIKERKRRKREECIAYENGDNSPKNIYSPSAMKTASADSQTENREAPKGDKDKGKKADNDDESPSRNPNVARLLVLHASAAALRDMPDVLAKKFGSHLVSYLNSRERSLKKWTHEFVLDLETSKAVSTYASRLHGLLHFKSKQWWEDMNTCLKSLARCAYHLMVESCEKQVRSRRSSSLLAKSMDSLNRTILNNDNDNTIDEGGEEDEDEDEEEEDNNSTSAVCADEGGQDSPEEEEAWPSIEVMRSYVQHLVGRRDELAPYSLSELKRRLGQHALDFSMGNSFQSSLPTSTGSIIAKSPSNASESNPPSRRMFSSAYSIDMSIGSTATNTVDHENTNVQVSTEQGSNDAECIAGCLEAPTMMIGLCAEVVESCLKVLEICSVIKKEIISNAELRKDRLEENSFRFDEKDEESDPSLPLPLSLDIKEKTDVSMSSEKATGMEGSGAPMMDCRDSDSDDSDDEQVVHMSKLLTREEYLIVKTLNKYEKKATKDKIAAIECGLQGKHALRSVLLLLRHLAAVVPIDTPMPSAFHKQENHKQYRHHKHHTTHQSSHGASYEHIVSSNRSVSSSISNGSEGHMEKPSFVDMQSGLFAYGNVLPVLLHPTVIKSLFVIVRELPADVHDEALALVSDLLKLNPELVVNRLRDPNMVVLEALSESASPDHMKEHYYHIVSHMFGGSEKGALAPGYKEDHPKSKAKSRKGKHLSEGAIKSQQLLRKLFVSCPSMANTTLQAQITSAPDIVRCVVEHFLHDSTHRMLSVNAVSTCHMLSFFSELVHTPCRELADNTPASNEMKNENNTSHLIPSLCDHILISDEMLSRVLRLIAGSSSLSGQTPKNTSLETSVGPEVTEDVTSQEASVAIQSHQVEDIHQSRLQTMSKMQSDTSVSTPGDLGSSINSTSSKRSRAIRIVEEPKEEIKRDENFNIKTPSTPFRNEGFDRLCYNEVIKQQPALSAASKQPLPAFESLGHVVLSSSKKGLYNKNVAVKWIQDLKKAAGANGTKAYQHNRSSNTTPTSNQDNAQSGVHSPGAWDQVHDCTYEQCMVDEQACKFICSCIADPSHAEYEVPKMVKLGFVSVIAQVTARWRDQHKHRNEVCDSTIDGRLAHHYAINALIYIAVSCRGIYIEDIAKCGKLCAASLKARLVAMKGLAKRKHSTDYSEQTAMSAIESILSVFNV